MVDDVMINRDAYIGQHISNYRLVEKIACGSFGCVYRAEHTWLKNRTVAIKLLNAPLASQQQHDSFMQEADLMVMLEHPHIPMRRRNWVL